MMLDPPQLDEQALLKKLQQKKPPAIRLQASPSERSGKLLEVGPTVLKASIPWAKQGELCKILPYNIEAEIVSVYENNAYLSPFTETTGLRQGLEVISTGDVHKMPLGAFLKGNIVDGLGRLMYASSELSPSLIEEYRPLDGGAPDPMSRALIDDPLPLGVCAIDGPLTCGQGQRVGIFAAAGGVKVRC